jgi:outer membrane protein assembly factor BamA
MKKFALALCLVLCCLGISALQIAEITLEADFPVDSSALITAGALEPGDEYDPPAIQAAIQRMLLYLQEQHFYYVEIPQPELVPLPDSRLKLVFKPRLVLDSGNVQIHFSGLRYFSADKLHEFIHTRPEDLYPLGELKDIIQRVLDQYHQRGYLFAAVSLDSLIASDPLMAYLRVDEGNRLEPENYIFQGNKVSRESYLLKASGLLKQEIISPRIISQAEENLSSKSYINRAALIPLDEKNLLIDIEEGRMTFLEGLIGIGEEGGKRQLSGMLKLDFLNLWGTDRAISLYWSRNPSAYNELIFNYHESGIPALALAGDISLSRTAQDSLWIRSKMDLDLYYRSLYQQLGMSFSANTVLPGNPDSQIHKDSETGIGLFWRYSDTRGGRIPSSGTRMHAAYDFFPGKNKYGKLDASTERFQGLYKNILAYISVNYLNNENRSPQVYDLFTMGGYASLRGYREDEFKSRRLAWMNLELRYMLGLETMLYCFYDHGMMLSAEDRIKSDLIGIGTGFKFGTRLGILSIEYGLGYRDKSFSRLGLGMVHIGLDIAL